MVITIGPSLANEDEQDDDFSSLVKPSSQRENHHVEIDREIIVLQSPAVS